MQVHDYEHACEDYFCNMVSAPFDPTVCEAGDGHDHGSAAWEWAGIFSTPDASYTWIAQKVDGDYADPTMRTLADCLNARAQRARERARALPWPMLELVRSIAARHCESRDGHPSGERRHRGRASRPRD